MGTISASLCQLCLNSGTGSSDGYAYETFQKIPFFGPISEYLRKIKGPNASKGILPSLPSFPSFPSAPTPNSQAPSPPAPFSLSGLINNLPTNIIKSQLELLNVGDTSFVRKIKKSSYEELVSKMTGTDQTFTDPDFPPNAQSLGKLDDKLLNSLTWKRIKDILPDAIFANGTIAPSDILQGSLGDCYLLSALASLAEQDYRVKSLFPKLDINPNGFYMARILHNGVLQ